MVLDTFLTNSYRGVVNKLKFALCLGLFNILLMPGSVEAAVAQSEVRLSSDFLYDVAKRYVLTDLAGRAKQGLNLIKLEDASAGFLKFRFQDGQFVDPEAIIEVIQLQGTQSKLRITMGADYGGRAQRLMDQIIRRANDRHAGKETVELPYPRSQVFQASLRYLLKRFVPDMSLKDQIVPIHDESGLLQFVYQVKNFRDPNTHIEVMRFGEAGSRLYVHMPKSSARKLLFQDELVKAIEGDLGTAAYKDTSN